MIIAQAHKQSNGLSLERGNNNDYYHHWIDNGSIIMKLWNTL